MAGNEPGTTQPFHDNFQSVGTSFVFTQGKNDGTVPTQAFRGPQLVGGSAAFSTWQPSDYQFYPRVAPNTLASNTDSVVMQDLPQLILTFKIIDSVVMQEVIIEPTGPVYTTDQAMMQDFPVLNITIVPPVDQVYIQDIPGTVAHQFVTNIDSVVMQDFNLMQVQIRVGPWTVIDTNRADSVTMQDLPRLSLKIPALDSVVMQDIPRMARNVNAKFTTAIQSAVQVNAKFGNEIQVAHYFPSPINVVGDYPYTSPPGGPTAPTANTVDPTVVFDGVPEITGTTTVKPLGQSYYSFLESQIAPNCDLMGFNLNMYIGGGTFMIETASAHPAVLGQVFTLLGIQCVVTKKGRSKNNRNSFMISGLVGDSRYLNKQILLTLDLSGVQGLGPLSPNTPLQSPSVLEWTSVAEAARAIAGAAGVSLSWLAKDAPLIDTFLETGQTVGESLRSLASRVGALISNDGLYSWNVFTPDTGFGAWGGLSNCLMLSEGGISEFSEIDINSAVVTIPVQPGSNSSVVYINSPLKTNKPLINTIYETRNVIKSGKLPAHIPVQGDFKKSYIQIIIDPDAITGADMEQAIVAPTIPVSATLAGATYGSNSITSPGVAPPKVALPWREYKYPVIADDQGNHLLVLQDTDFPAWLIDGKFTLRVGYSRDEQAIADVYTKNFEEAVQRNRLYLQYQQESIRYFPVASWQITFKFAGSLPMPGNRCTFTISGFNVDGVVDSVSMTKDYDVTVTITKSVKLNLLSPKAQLDYFLATNSIAP